MDNSLQTLLNPIVLYCLKHAVGIQELLEAARIVFVNRAAEELKAAGEKPSVSRLSIITGLQRPVVKRCLAGIQHNDPMRFTMRVISVWRNDSRFSDKRKQPRTLQYEGEKHDFKALVHAVSCDLHPATILFDLERLKLVEVGPKGIRLKSKAFSTRRDAKEGHRMLARDSEDLMMAILDNLQAPDGPLPNYHGETSFDNISPEDLENIRTWLFKRMGRFHRDVEKYLSKFDLDLHPRSGKKGGKRVAVGLFSRTT